MDEPWAAYAAAAALGAAHALEVDHMVAINIFIGRQPRVAQAVGFGIRWGLGHGVVVMGAGLVLSWSGLALPPVASGWAEIGVGMMLVGLGLWALRGSQRLHIHSPTDHGGHAHLHAHSPNLHPHSHAHADPQRRHRHLPTLVGALHGLVGTAPVVALIPVTLLTDQWSVLGYLAAFGAGTVAAMGSYTSLAALAVRKASSSLTVAQAVARMTALASFAVGVWWIARAGSALVRL